MEKKKKKGIRASAPRKEGPQVQTLPLWSPLPTGRSAQIERRAGAAWTLVARNVYMLAYQQSVKRDWHWLHLASTLPSPKCLLREVGVRGKSAASIDDSKKWKYIPSSWIRRIFIVKMAI